jgi:hypothetical protein
MLGFYREDEVQFGRSPSIDPESNFQPTIPMETSTLQPTEGNVVSVHVIRIYLVSKEYWGNILYIS